MYYLIELKQGKIEILKNVFKEGHKLVALNQILKETNINLVDDDYKLDEAGLYCVKHSNDCYRLFRYITEVDGYLFYGARYEVDVSYLTFVYYINEMDELEGLTDALKQLGIKDKLDEADRKERVRKERMAEMKRKIELEEGGDSLDV